jgi:hypothetical protein
LETTGQLANVVRRALGYKQGAPKDPATRSFQAIRIHVNDELGELEALLATAESLLNPGGRLAIVSFHSLEDRIVKQFFKDASGVASATSRHMPMTASAAPAVYTAISKAIRAGEVELTRNPRARVRPPCVLPRAPKFPPALSAPEVQVRSDPRSHAYDRLGHPGHLPCAYSGADVPRQCGEKSGPSGRKANHG